MDTVIIIVLTALLAVGLTFFLRPTSTSTSAPTPASDWRKMRQTRSWKKRKPKGETRRSQPRTRLLILGAELDRELTQRRKEIERIENRIEQKEENIDRKSAANDQREQAIKQRDNEAQQAREAWEQTRARQQQELEEARGRHLQELERIAGLSADATRSSSLSTR